MRKKTVFVYAHSMEIGGAEKALLGLLETFDPERYDVDLFLLRHIGPWMEDIPEHINVLPQNRKYSAMGVPLKHAILKNKAISVVCGRIIGLIKSKWYTKRHNIMKDSNVHNEYSHKYTVWAMPPMSKKSYDVAISFLSPHYYVQKKVKARLKIAWLHTDYTTWQIDRQSEYRMWSVYDYIFSVSEGATKGFLGVFPDFRPKVAEMMNILPIQQMKRLVNAFSVADEMQQDGSIRLLSVGRFTYAKNFDNVPEICKRIVECGLNVKWYLIGYGSDEQLIKDKIREFSMQDRVIILGEKSNPYPYIDSCDVYVQPSRFEGKSVSVCEAQALGKPTIITDYPTAQSQLIDKEDGFIVPMEIQACADSIANLLKQPDKLARCASNTCKYDYSNAGEIMKLYRLMEQVK